MTHRTLDPGTVRADFSASLVVFLVAVPLCVGVAVASGVPAELGLITGIVGGLVTGLLPGSSLQVSGPAAGLTVLVAEAVEDYGLPSLGAIVLASGLLQLAMGALRLGRWFRAISVAVVHGMLAGIGLVIMAGQLYSLAGQKAPGSGPDKIFGMPAMLVRAIGSGPALTALAIGTATIAVLVVWPKIPRASRVVPGPLAAVVLATGACVAFDLPVARVRVSGLLDAIQPPGTGDLAGLAGVGLITTVLAFTLIASAESLFSAAAVDRLHAGPRTEYDKELMAQGLGNAVCGALGALPMTAVIVRSAANVQAGARTKLSRILHGGWLLLFATLLPDALGMIPIATLAGVLVHAGWKLIPVSDFGPLWREHRGEALILSVTAIAIVVTDMFEGVLIGLLMAIVKTAWETSHVQLEVEDLGQGPVIVRLLGNATFLRLPRLLDQLESLPRDRAIELDLRRLRHLDHAVGVALVGWAERHNSEGVEPVRVQHSTADSREASAGRTGTAGDPGRRGDPGGG